MSYGQLGVQEESIFCSPAGHCSFLGIARKCTGQRDIRNHRKPGDERKDRGTHARARRNNDRSQANRRVSRFPEQEECELLLNRRDSRVPVRFEDATAKPAPDFVPDAAPRSGLCIRDELRSQPRRSSPHIHALTPPPRHASFSGAAMGTLNQTKPGLRPGLRSFWGNVGTAILCEAVR
jgi:hypothetical protein